MSRQSGVSYTNVDKSYFEKRGLRRYAGVWSLWALGVGAVISGHFSGWNLGLANGWGSMLIATIIIAVMLYYQLTGDPAYTRGVLWVALWFGVCIAYFALVGRHRLILSPEEEFALAQREKAGA